MTTLPNDWQLLKTAFQSAQEKFPHEHQGIKYGVDAILANRVWAMTSKPNDEGKMIPTIIMFDDMKNRWHDMSSEGGCRCRRRNGEVVRCMHWWTWAIYIKYRRLLIEKYGEPEWPL